ncbi:MAG: hypothetical protein KQI78_20920 [Deltaproteobacteria bacterium]|jgi:hypothetical protein|nr:hypothetical protein [Deltaproteobacteria bacterium]
MIHRETPFVRLFSIPRVKDMDCGGAILKIITPRRLGKGAARFDRIDPAG